MFCNSLTDVECKVYLINNSRCYKISQRLANNLGTNLENNITNKVQKMVLYK